MIYEAAWLARGRALLLDPAPSEEYTRSEKELSRERDCVTLQGRSGRTLHEGLGMAGARTGAEKE